eukprot:Seg1930.5 transcript_id=Seg1930.5/GoldUCD/mRNA.D3Y31 product="Rho-related GTP-binding protein RhoD" protein_id=Seg1930.5/GoldUCD/D3Y31
MNGNTTATSKDPLKVLLLGDEGCGKTSLLKTYTGKNFDEEYNPSVFEYYTATVALENKNSLGLNLWDASGSPDFDHVRPLSYKDTDVFLLCFDVSRESSLNNISKKWLIEMFENRPGKPFLLVGLKSDLRSDASNNDEKEEKFVTQAQALKFAKTIKAFDYLECSSRNMNDQIEKVFVSAARLGLGLNRRYSWKKRSVSCDMEADKSKCLIS